MKLLFAIKALNDTRGGAERVLADVTAGLVARGHEVIVMTFDAPGGQAFYPLDERVRRIDLGVGCTSSSSTADEFIARMKSLRDNVRHEFPDVAVGFMHSMFIPLAFALVGTGIPVVASEHIVPAHYKTRRAEFLLLQFSSFFVKKITVLSEAVKTQYPAFMQKKMTPVANPVRAPDVFADPVGEGRDTKTILNVGRLDPQKDQETLIRAFALLADDYPDWQVKIVGDGALRPALERLITELNLVGRVELAVTSPDIAVVYQDAQIFALPSLYESFGLATAEAMAHGLPAVGFASCPGTNELIIDGENGALAEAGDRVHNFAAAMKRLMDDPVARQRYGHAARAIAGAYDPVKICAAWEVLLASFEKKS